jgi:DNA-binding MarR family transcriptional regulator
MILADYLSRKIFYRRLQMTRVPQHPVTDPVEMHQRYWSDNMDLDTVALVFALHRASEAVMAPSREVWTRHDLTPAEFDVLATLRRSPPPRELTPSDIRSLLLVTSGGLTKIMAALEARGLVSRSRSHADQRIRPIRLTPSGKRLVEAAMADVMASSPPRIRNALNARELAKLTELLDKLAG